MKSEFSQTKAKPATNTPTAILSAWTSLEVLSPFAYRRPEDLAINRDRSLVSPLDRPVMPWKTGGHGRREMKLYYQIVLGSVKLEDAIAKLLARYTDTRAERPQARGASGLAVIVVNKDGKPVDEPAVAVSSFAWGVPRALKGNLEDLAEWPTHERQLVEQLDARIRRFDKNGDLVPLDAETLQNAFDWLVGLLGLTSDLVEPPTFAVRSYEYYKNPEPPEPLLLNSFFLGDLARVRDQFAQGKATSNLRRYLRVDLPLKQQDLLHDRKALAAAVAPGNFPPARWPGPGRYPLVLLQQAAVNLALTELKTDGILAVNGPPGTGKTTLLRDIVAALVTARAERMVLLSDPATAFEHSGQKFPAGKGWLHLYRLEPKLRGFEMLVASSNNKAVENVSAELPGLEAIAEDATELRYFTTLSTALRDRETWGLIAAVLGNARNRGRFKQTFWWNEDVGLSTYLAAAGGTPQVVEIIDDSRRKKITRPPRIVTEENAPKDHNEALRRWQQARKHFIAALEKSKALLKELDAVRALCETVPQLTEAQVAAKRNTEVQGHALDEAEVSLRDSERTLTDFRIELKNAEDSRNHHARARPFFLARIFKPKVFRAWKQVHELRTSTVQKISNIVVRAETVVAERRQLVQHCRTEKQNADLQLAAVAERLQSATRQIRSLRERIGPSFVDDEFFERHHSERHKLSPWLNSAAQRIRDDVFITAVKVHKAFADAAAKPLRHNLGALMSAFSGRSFSASEKESLLADLWASLFLVVPVISTTFASVDRMIGKLPPQSLGWLLIDEAGQALPQAAVGAIMRTSRAVVVGDPIQIEPVVVLPDSLTEAICRKFQIDPHLYNAPAASVQTLADAATPFTAEFATEQGSRTVGVPLLVHRRCSEPMFGISNAVAYGRLMINAKEPKSSAIRELLGPPRWIDVQGTAEEKWCPQEGALVVEILRQMAKANIGSPNIYIITPFVIVQDNLRKLIRQSGVLNAWTDEPWEWANERVGTIHTVQGREAEAVIFVLGAPAVQQTGARNWAGGRPNLLNVAVTRAKEALYVIGNRKLWRNAGLFRQLDARLPN
jgi:AAA domain